MSTPEAVVQEFCSAFSAKDVDTIGKLLADDVVYHNVGMAPAVGKEASLAMIQGFLDMAEKMEFEIHRIATNGDTVLTERQKQVLLEIYESFRRENAARSATDAEPDPHTTEENSNDSR